MSAGGLLDLIEAYRQLMTVICSIERLTICRPRLDRDALFLFGRRYAAQTVTLTGKETTQLHHGRTIAIDVVGEYLIYLQLRGDR